MKEEIIRERIAKDKVLNYLCDINCFEQGYTIRNMPELLSDLKMDFEELRLILCELKDSYLFKELSFNNNSIFFVIKNSAKEFKLKGGFLGEIKVEDERQERNLYKEKLAEELNLLNIKLAKTQLRERKRNFIIAILSILLTIAGTYIAYLSYIEKNKCLRS